MMEIFFESIFSPQKHTASIDDITYSPQNYHKEILLCFGFYLFAYVLVFGRKMSHQKLYFGQIKKNWWELIVNICDDFSMEKMTLFEEHGFWGIIWELKKNFEWKRIEELPKDIMDTFYTQVGIRKEVQIPKASLLVQKIIDEEGPNQ